MTIEDNKEAARRLMKGVSRGKVNADMLADNFVLWNEMTGDLWRAVVLGILSTNTQ